MEWQARVVSEMVRLKRAGWEFDRAWHRALVLYPPRGRDCGPLRPTLLDRDESLVAFFRNACDDAWHNRRPALVHLGNALPVPDDNGHGWGSPQARKKTGAVAA